MLGVIAGGYLAPRHGELARRAERDLAAGGPLSADYQNLNRRVRTVSGLASLLVLVTIFVMANHLRA